MPDSNPIKLLVKLPVPVPSVVLLLLIVGAVDVLQHTPRAVTVAPPSEVIFPPAVAVFNPIVDGVAVVRVSTAVCAVVNETSLP